MRRVSFVEEKRKPYQTLIQRKKGCFDSVAPQRMQRKRSTFFRRHFSEWKKNFFVVLLETIKKTTGFFVALLSKKKKRVLSDVISHKKQRRFGSLFPSFGSLASKSIKEVGQVLMGSWKAQVSALLVIVIVSGTYLLPLGSQGATYTFTQNSWSGGVTVNTAVHPGNQTNWNEYTSQSGLTVGTDVKLPATGYTFTDDGTTIPQGLATGGGFGNGTNNITQVTGSGSGARVEFVKSGLLTALSPATRPTGTQPRDITISSDGTSVYVANYGSNTLSQYSRNTSTGLLTPLTPATISAGANPIGITISPDGISVYVTNSGNTTVSQYSRNTSTGLLTPLTPATISAETSPRGITISSDGTSVYVANYGSNTLSQYSRNTSTGLLTPLTPATISTGIQPNNVIISSDGMSVYVNNYNEVSQYSRNTSTGLLTQLTPATISTMNGSYSITISPDGTSVYVTNYDYQRIFQYNRNIGTGLLTYVDTINTSNSPYGIVISSSGASAYTANLSSSNVSQYNRNTSTGILTPLTPETISAGASPIGITISPDGTSVYVTNYGNVTVSQYNRFPEVASGTFTSAVINLGASASFSTFGYATTLNGQTITMDVRAGNTATPDGSWTSWTTGVANGGDISSLSGNQYMQYRANFSTTDPSVSPTLDSVTIDYSQYTSGEILSSPYDSSSNANLLSKMSWTATNTSASDTVKLQVRSASTLGGLTSASWCGYTDCSGSTYFTESDNGVTLSPTHPLMTGSDDQYFQYRVTLTSGGAITPILTSVTSQYVVNAAPEFDTAYNTNGLAVSQISDNLDSDWGKIRIIYRVKDFDTTDGTNTPGYITPSFAYDNGSGFVTINSANLSINATANKSVDIANYTQYEAIWDAKTDITNTYSTTLSVKVTVNDNEAANNTATATDTITFDSKAPTLGSYPVLVDASLTPASVTLSATDDSTIEMKVGLNSDLSGSTYEAYNGTKLLTLATNPDIVYVQYRDVYNNETIISSVTSTETPTLMIIQDVSNALNNDWKLFISWRTVAEPFYGFANYKLYASGDNVNFSLVATINSRSTNYYIDETVTFDTIRYYKVKMTDNVGNVSWMSSTLQGKPNGTQDSGEGGGGSETTPPAISNVIHSAVSTTQVTITWDTNELSTSTVGFSVNSGFFTDEIGVFNYADNTGGSGIHSVVLTGLTPATTYFYQVKSSDPAGNEGTDNNGGTGYTFTTNPGPAISNVALSSAANTQATIGWNTDIPASTYISYSTEKSETALVAPTEVGTTPLTTSHIQTISGLQPGTVYYFFVKSEDTDSNMALDTNGGVFYQFTTTTDNTSPVISTLGASVITYDRVAITWLTDEQSTSQIRYATTGGGPYTSTTETVTYGQDHFVILPSLVADTTYYFKAYSADLSGNTTLSSQNSFKTLPDPSFQHDPLTSITGMNTVLITDTNAVISLVTDQPALCTIEYGTAPSNYAATPVTETLENKRHSITLPSLLFSTIYYYQATCIDNLDTVVVSDEASFTTKPIQVDSGSEGGDLISPTISSVNVSDVTGENATVTWSTDEVSNGYVRYGITTDYGDMSGEDVINSAIETYAVEHTIFLKNLIPSTKYYFVVLSSDARGNLTTSSESSFTTTSPSTISSINIVSNKIGEAVLAWKTSTLMSSIVEYGLSETYGDKQESNTQTKTHTMTVNKLESNQLYHFRVKGKDKLNNLFASSDYTFSPRSLPGISNVTTKVLSDTEVEVSFNTSVPTDASVSYTNTKESSDTGSQGKPDLSLSHTVVLKGLKPGSVYNAKIVATDEAGNKVTQDAKNFTTSQDTTAPEIDQLKTDMALAQDGKVQAIVSWYTDEPATTSIAYKEGSNGEEKTIDMPTDPSTSHVIVLTSFKIGSVYFLKAKSIDKAGNESISREKMIITPQQTENVVQMIIGNFNDMFGWAKF
ncbi:MAG: beta-propeller fold lactonase family protein [Candidatus Moranbacteria bacterium]|nr:beta-propeller fold lactonase family protein [Candidatus Moranbacteria bacterium]MDD3965135.1 beta-propeller fold lactonase family protein [Candidatus Moranbacteria bacterium]